MLRRYTTTRAVVLIAVVALLVGSLPGVAAAQSAEDWSVWLFDLETQALTRVYLDGRTESLALPLAPGARVQGPRGVAFSADSRLVAACVNTGQKDVFQVKLFDVGSGAEQLSYDIGPAVTCDLGRAAFNAAQTRLAFSMVRYWPQQPGADTSQPMWELVVLDIASGQVAGHLTPASAAIVAQQPYGIADPMPMLADPLRFDGDQMTFVLQPFGVGGMFVLEAYTWQVGSETLGRDEIFNQPGVDWLPTGEAVWVGTDPALPMREVPADAMPLPVGPYNAVFYSDGAGNTYPVYNEPADMFGSAFVDEGRRVVVHTVNAVNADGTYLQHWVAVDRGGVVVELPLGEGAETPINAPGGFVYLDHDVSGVAGGQPAIRLMAARFDGAAISTSALWQTDSMSWVVAWAAPVPPAADLAPFPPLVGG